MESSHIKVSLGFLVSFIPLAIVLLAIVLLAIFIQEKIQEQGFWRGLTVGIVSLFLYLLFFISVSCLFVWIFADDAKTLIRDIKHKDFAIDYIPPITLDAYRKFKIDKEIYAMCEEHKYSPACFSLANEYVIHDNRNRSEYYLKKIINNEMDGCRLNSDISACENIIKAYKKLDDMEEVKEYKKLVDALKEQRNLSY